MSIYTNNTLDIRNIKDNKYILTINNYLAYKNYIKWVLNKLGGEKLSSIKYTASETMLFTEFLKKEYNKLSYKDATLLFLNLGEQLKCLEDDGYGIFQLNKDDIVVVKLNENETIFLFCNLFECLPIVDKKFEIITPYNINYKYHSPELSILNGLPYRYSYYKSIIYSIAVLVSDCLFPMENKLINFNDFEKHLEEILETKLYWALLRCLEKDPQDRFFLYI